MNDADRPTIDPHLGLNLRQEGTLDRQSLTASVVIPAHNEEATVTQVVREAFGSLTTLGVEGEVIVSASGCTDATEAHAAEAGARVISAPIGKGAALREAVAVATGDAVVMIDADVQYFGSKPLVALLLEPILDGIADVTITDLYWRPLYPQLSLNGFFWPLAGSLFPEMLPKIGSTPWSGQRATLRNLWPDTLPDDFTVDLALLIHWNKVALQMRPVLTGDWVNPQRPKPNLMRQEFDFLVAAAVADERIVEANVEALVKWFEATHRAMAEYVPDVDDPQEFERRILRRALAQLPPLSRPAPSS